MKASEMYRTIARSLGDPTKRLEDLGYTPAALARVERYAEREMAAWPPIGYRPLEGEPEHPDAIEIAAADLQVTDRLASVWRFRHTDDWAEEWRQMTEVGPIHLSRVYTRKSDGAVCARMATGGWGATMYGTHQEIFEFDPADRILVVR